MISKGVSQQVTNARPGRSNYMNNERNSLDPSGPLELD